MTMLTDEGSIVPETSGSGPAGERIPSIRQTDLVFNVVWTGSVFSHLGVFLESQIAQSEARFRFIANACEPGQVQLMEQFSDRHPGRVVEVMEVSVDRMVRHGDALDQVLRTRDDGPCFSFIDPDIIATGPFLPPFLEALEDADVVTSGRELWSDCNVRPVEQVGVNGEYFFDTDGYVFGSPHFAIYRRPVLLETQQRWKVGFTSSGNDIGQDALDRLEALGRRYWIYDTAKIVNILLQGDGGIVHHQEEPNLVHIGGVSHFLAPPSSAPAARDLPPAWGEGSDWGTAPAMVARHQMARFTAEMVAAAAIGQPIPEVPRAADGAMADRLALARRAVVDLVAIHGSPPPLAGGDVR